MSRLVYSSFLAFLIVFSPGCLRRKCEEHLISNDVKEHCIFKPGTWWLIQNDSTLSQDSIILDQTERRLEDHCDEANPYFQETFYIHIKGFWGSGGYITIDTKVESSFYYSKFWAYWDPSGDETYLPARHDSMTVNGKTYFDVIEVWNTDGFHRYYARNFYCIKAMNPQTGESLSLLNAHIVQ